MRLGISAQTTVWTRSGLRRNVSRLDVVGNRRLTVHCRLAIVKVGVCNWVRSSVVIVCSSHKWTGTSSRTSVTWSWSNRNESGTQYMPALDCCLLTFWRWKCRVHSQIYCSTVLDIYPMLALTSVTFFLVVYVPLVTDVWTVTLSDTVRCPWSLLILCHLNHFRW